MNQPERDAANALFVRVQAILHAEWDPIGASVPLDEYDSYVWPVVRLLLENAGADAVASYLRRAANEAMSSPVPETRLASVVSSLMALVP